MSSALFVQALTRGSLAVRRRQHVSGEVMISFSDKTISPIFINNDNPVIVTDHAGATVRALQRSNIGDLIASGYLEVV